MAEGPHSPRSEATRALGSLAFSCVRVEDPMLLLRAAGWHNALVRVGVAVPFWLTHDLGMLAVVEPSRVPIDRRPSLTDGRLGGHGAAHHHYRDTLRELSTTEVFEKAR